MISSAFESSLGLSHHAALAAALPLSNGVTYHGLATAAWLQRDLTQWPLLPAPSHDDTMALSACRGQEVISESLQHAADTRPEERVFEKMVHTDAAVYCLRRGLEWGPPQGSEHAVQSALPMVFLHGFLGGALDWAPIAGNHFLFGAISL